MWGNRTGWTIAAVMVVLYAGLLWVIGGAGRMTSPTQWSRSDILQQPLALPAAPQTVVSMSEAGDAGTLYRDAIADYRARSKTYDDYLLGRTKEIDRSLPGIKAVLEAAPKMQARIFIDDPISAIGWTSSVPELEALDRVGKAVTKLGMVEVRGNRARGVQYLEAAFALGAKLFDERLSYAQMSRGLGLMSGAATVLEKNTEGADQRKYADFLAGYRTFNPQVFEVQKVISALPTPGRRDRTAGDIFAVAQNPNADRVWRVEAVLKLGRFRFNAPTAGDQRGANRVLKEIAAAERDPAVRTAAQMALDLTDVQFRQLGR